MERWHRHSEATLRTCMGPPWHSGHPRLTDGHAEFIQYPRMSPDTKILWSNPIFGLRASGLRQTMCSLQFSENRGYGPGSVEMNGRNNGRIVSRGFDSINRKGTRYSISCIDNNLGVFYEDSRTKQKHEKGLLGDDEGGRPSNSEKRTETIPRR
jgi:hypothetical protein